MVINKKCPHCLKNIKGYSAISRIDNKTEICSNCGTIEALQTFINFQRKESENGKNNNKTNKFYK